MEPIVYIYQDHLQDFWNSGQSQCFGAAFEWKGLPCLHQVSAGGSDRIFHALSLSGSRY